MWVEGQQAVSKSFIQPIGKGKGEGQVGMTYEDLEGGQRVGGSTSLIIHQGYREGVPKKGEDCGAVFLLNTVNGKE